MQKGQQGKKKSTKRSGENERQKEERNKRVPTSKTAPLRKKKEDYVLK